MKVELLPQHKPYGKSKDYGQNELFSDSVKHSLHLKFVLDKITGRKSNRINNESFINKFIFYLITNL